MSECQRVRVSVTVKVVLCFSFRMKWKSCHFVVAVIGRVWVFDDDSARNANI